MDISNKIIVITGASKGLGKETAIHLSKLGARLILVARSENLLKEVKNKIQNFTSNEILCITCDISNESDVISMAAIIKERFQRVDVLINNAGIGIYKPLESLSNQEMRKHFDVNFYGAYYCIKAILPLLKLSDSAYILNIGSIFCKVSLMENSVYAASKFALAGFTQGLCSELKKYNIYVGLFLPGPMNTSFQDNRRKEAIKAPDFLMLNLKKVVKVIEYMIRKKKKQVYMYKWMLVGLKLKQFFS